MAYILTQLVSPPDVTTRTIRMRPFERVIELEAVPDVEEDFTEDKVEVIEIDDDASDDVVMESAADISPSKVNDDDDAVYSSDDDSYEREVKAGVRAKDKLLEDDDDDASKADDDSDFVMEDMNNDPEVDMDLDLVEGEPPKVVTATKSATKPKLKAPPQNQPLPHAAANQYAQQMQQLQQRGHVPYQWQQLQMPVNPHGPQLQGPCFAAPLYTQTNPVQLLPANSQPSPRVYTVVLPVTPQGLGMKICESKGNIVFLGFVDQMARQSCISPGDTIIGIDGVSVERIAPIQVTNLLRQNEGKKERILIMRSRK
jgi:hypothetical protein